MGRMTEAAPDEGTGMFPELDEPCPHGAFARDLALIGDVDACRAVIDKTEALAAEDEALLRADYATDDPDERERIAAKRFEVAGRVERVWRVALRRPVRAAVGRPRPRGAGRPACSRHTRRRAASSTSGGADPEEDGPAPPAHSRRRRRWGRRS